MGVSGCWKSRAATVQCNKPNHEGHEQQEQRAQDHEEKQFCEGSLRGLAIRVPYFVVFVVRDD
jgi:hypothetical protein